jgi:hypothetical protein
VIRLALTSLELPHCQHNISLLVVNKMLRLLEMFYSLFIRDVARNLVTQVYVKKMAARPYSGAAASDVPWLSI